MHKIDLICPSCSGILKSKSDLDNLGPGVHRVSCEYCGYHGLLEIKGDRVLTLEEIEKQSYAKARGEYKAKFEYDKEKRKSNFFAYFMTFVILSIISISIYFYIEFSKIKLNPFDYVKVEFSGLSGEGKAEIIEIPPSEDSKILLSNINYKLSNDYKLKEGEQITLSADSKIYKLTNSQLNLVVKGLQVQLKDINSISQKARDAINESTITEVKENFKDAESKAKNIKYSPAGMYLVSDLKEKNRLMDVIEMDITFEDGSKGKYFGAVTYNNISVYDGNSPTFKSTGKWSLHGPIQKIVSDTGISIGHTFIYSSLEAAKTEAKRDINGEFTEFEY